MSSADLPLYLVKKENLIVIQDRVVIARKEGNIIISIDHASKQWECSPAGKSIFVDGSEIMPGTLAPLHAGSVLIIGPDEYKVFNNKEQAENTIPKISRRKLKRPKHPYDPLNLVHFFAAPTWALGTYIFLFAYALSRFLPRMKLTTTSEALNFLAESYNGRTLSNTVWLVLLVYVLCLLHSFLMYVYVNRTAGRRFVGALGLILIGVFAIYAISKPLSDIHTYLSVREEVHNKNATREEVAINHMKKYVGFKTSLTKTYDLILPTLTAEKRPALTRDFEESIQLVDAELKSEVK